MSTPPLGVVHDVDGVLGIASPRRQLGRFRALLTRGPGDRRSVLGLPHLLRVLSESQPEPPVFYLTAVPSRWSGPSPVSCSGTATRRARR